MAPASPKVVRFTIAAGLSLGTRALQHIRKPRLLPVIPHVLKPTFPGGLLVLPTLALYSLAYKRMEVELNALLNIIFKSYLS